MAEGHVDELLHDDHVDDHDEADEESMEGEDDSEMDEDDERYYDDDGMDDEPDWGQYNQDRWAFLQERTTSYNPAFPYWDQAPEPPGLRQRVPHGWALNPVRAHHDKSCSYCGKRNWVPRVDWYIYNYERPQGTQKVCTTAGCVDRWLATLQLQDNLVEEILADLRMRGLARGGLPMGAQPWALALPAAAHQAPAAGGPSPVRTPSRDEAPAAPASPTSVSATPIREGAFCISGGCTPAPLPSRQEALA